jgi:hypothetical protein
MVHPVSEGVLENPPKTTPLTSVESVAIHRSPSPPKTICFLDAYAAFANRWIIHWVVPYCFAN